VILTASCWNKYPLLVACKREFREIAITLLDRGADANVRQNNPTPLKLAAAHGDAVLVKKLLYCGAEANQMKNIVSLLCVLLWLHATVTTTKGSLLLYRRY